MRTIKQLCYVLIIIILTVLYPQVSFAEECNVLEHYPEDAYRVKINGKEYLAINDEKKREGLKIEQDLITARKIIERKDTLIKTLEEAITHYEDTLSKQKDYVTQMEVVLNSYKELLEGYKKVRTKSKLSFEVGAGATQDFNPAALLGIGIYRFRGWGFFQKDNLGVIIGAEIPIF